MKINKKHLKTIRGQLEVFVDSVEFEFKTMSQETFNADRYYHVDIEMIRVLAEDMIDDLEKCLNTDKEKK